MCDQNREPSSEPDHDDECAESIRYYGACRHGHAFPGGCDNPTCEFRNG